MTPKEKAEELVSKFFPSLEDSIKLELVGVRKKYSKQCALITVDYMYEVFTSACIAMGMDEEDALKKESEYLNEVKKEIEKL